MLSHLNNMWLLRLLAVADLLAVSLLMCLGSNILLKRVIEIPESEYEQWLKS